MSVQELDVITRLSVAPSMSSLYYQLVSCVKISRFQQPPARLLTFPGNSIRIRMWTLGTVRRHAHSALRSQTSITAPGIARSMTINISRWTPANWERIASNHHYGQAPGSQRTIEEIRGLVGPRCEHAICRGDGPGSSDRSNEALQFCSSIFLWKDANNLVRCRGRSVVFLLLARNRLTSCQPRHHTPVPV